MKRAGMQRWPAAWRHELRAIRAADMQDAWRPGRAAALPVSLWAVVALVVSLLVWGIGWRTGLQGLQRELLQEQAAVSSLAGQVAHAEARQQAMAQQAEMLSQRQQAQLAFLSLLPEAPGLAELIDVLTPLLPDTERERWSVQALEEKQQGPVTVLPFRVQLRGSYAAISEFMQALVLLPRMISSHDFSLQAGTQADGRVLRLGMAAYYCPDSCFPVAMRPDEGLSVMGDDGLSRLEGGVSFQGRDPFSMRFARLSEPEPAVLTVEQGSETGTPALAEYALSQLRQVGRLESAGKVWLLVATPEGQVHRVSPDEPVGQEGRRLPESIGELGNED